MNEKTIKTKGRGGAGRGQGRKFKLSHEDRLWIYDRFWSIYQEFRVSNDGPKRKIEDMLEQVANEAAERFKGKFRQKITARYVRDIKDDKKNEFSTSKKEIKTNK